MAQIVNRDKKARQFKFYMPVPDMDVQKMLLSRDHRITLKFDSEWDIALYVGGPDVCPMFYGESLHKTTTCNIKRDLDEIATYKAIHHRRMKVGICRGAQLLNIMSGGRLWQHVNGHMTTTGHRMRVFDSKTEHINVSSRHHQMMIAGSEGWVMGASKEATTLINMTLGHNDLSAEEREKKGWNDPEIVFYPNTNSICFQPHPEDNDDLCRDLFFKIINDFWSDDDYKASQLGWDGDGA